MGLHGRKACRQSAVIRRVQRACAHDGQRRGRARRLEGFGKHCRRESNRRRIRVPFPRARADGAFEHDRSVRRRTRGGLGWFAVSDDGSDGDCRSPRPQAGAGHVSHGDGRRRFRQACRARLARATRSGANCQASERHAGKINLDARGRRAGRLLQTDARPPC